jgi:hypothetical protein
VTIPKISLGVTFTVDSTNNTLTANFSGNATRYTADSDYTYSWTKSSITGVDSGTISGANTRILTGISPDCDYSFYATNNKNSALSITANFNYYDRTVIYVNYSSGVDTNDGLTTSTAVKTMKTAYSKLNINGNIYSNIIVIVGDYTNTDYLYATSSTYSTVSASYSKPATITGLYKSNNYNAGLYMGTSDTSNGGQDLFADTRFMYMKMYGNTSSSGTGTTFLYAQGHSLTMDEGVVMQRYAVSSTSYGLSNGNAPDFHIIGEYLNYNYSNLPSTSNNFTITIKSGTYSRILGGSRNTGVNSTSHNFTGSASNYMNEKIVIDIQNSTTNKSTYPSDINSIFSAQTDGNVYENMEMQIKGGVIGRVVGGSLGYNRVVTGYPSNSYFGSTKMTISGGTIGELFGASLGRSQSDVYYYGNIEINLTGGTISNNIYTAGAGGVVGYDSSSSDPYKSYGQNISSKVTFNMSGGTVSGNVYGAGYGYSAYLDASTIASDGGALYGNSYVNISGGNISGSIYGGGKGTSSYSGKTTLAQMKGNSYINISNSPIISGSIYGAGEGISGYLDMAKFTGNSYITLENGFSGNIYGAGNIATCVGSTNINIKNGTFSGEVYGGGNLGNVVGNSNVNLNGGTLGIVYAGGKSSSVTNSNVTLNGATVSNIYGGSNSSGYITTSVVNLTSGTVDTVYGGNNSGGNAFTTTVNSNGASVLNAIYGGGNKVSTNVTNLNIKNTGNKIPNVYASGNQAGADTTVTNIKGGTIGNIFGGSNVTGDVLKTILNVSSGNMDSVYGGNNQGGTTNTTNINVTGGVIGTIYGGGEKATAVNSNIKIGDGTISNIYGGGDQAGLTSSNIEMAGGTIGNVFGGSNLSGNVTTTNVKTSNSLTLSTSSTAVSNSTVPVATLSISAVASTSATSWQSTTYPTIATITVTLTNPTSTAYPTWNAYVIAANSTVFANNSSTALNESNGTFTFNQVNKWYGTNPVAANGGTYSFSFDVLSMQPVSSFTCTSGIGTPGGGSGNGNTTSVATVTDINTTVTGKNLNISNNYGGNNQGGLTSSSKLNLNYGTIQNVYGGGNQADTTSTDVTVSNIVTGCIYGGGDEADVSSSKLTLNGANVTDNVYGGGNQGAVNGNTTVRVTNSTLGNSLYAGGNGQYATVYGNTNLVMDGTTNKITNSVFGGGNQASTGTSSNKSSTSTLNIVGATIGKNVYGGANTSVVYGTTLINIGYDSVGDNTLTKGDIKISGTVFGGGEANAAGSEVYDFSFISVTNGININLNGNGHSEYYIKGSIFGSGNASSTSGSSYINIKNYGTIDNPIKSVSIQRATQVVLDNSAVVLSGAKDRTNEYSNVNFSISRVNVLKLKNNSTLYLNYGANLLQNLYSLVDLNGIETNAAVTIDSNNGNTVKNADNRVYMYEGKVLNIATNEQVTAYGKVYGMTFLGMYTSQTNPATSTGMYNHNFSNGDEITNMGTFSSNSYVLAQHKDNHDTKVDGFYTTINNSGYAKSKYIDVTPEEDLYYIWSVGEALNVTNFELTLTASKYVTLGTYELPLTGFSTPNTKYYISGFSSGLNDGITLVDKSEIDAIDKTGQASDTKFGLTMKSGKNGWKTNSLTSFDTDSGDATYTGSNQYIGDNSTYTPSLDFCFYHSQNLTLSQNLGNVKIRLQVLTPVDDLTYSISYIDVNINMMTALYQDDYYESAITPGKEFSLFNNTETNITNKSVFSSYYSLYIPNFNKSKYYSSYSNSKRVIVSRTTDNQDVVYKANTKITMIDLVTNTTYYYVVTSQDESLNKCIYPLTDFKKMGSTNEYYDRNVSNNIYYNSSQNLLYESYIFQVDFSGANQNSQITDATLLMEMQDQDNQTLVGVLGIQRDACKYSVYQNKDATINVSATTNSDNIYLGQVFDLDINTEFKQNVDNSKIIYDTKYFDLQMGIKISIFDNNRNQLSSDDLLGIKFILDGKTYYPRFDGTVRINIAERVSNILSKIKVDTSQNDKLSTGIYKIKVESFGSPDGIYYGITSSGTTTKSINLINSSYGLKTWLDDKSKIVDKQTGNTLYGNNTLLSHIEYTSGVANPKITVLLQRRDYSTTYSLNYTTVDLKEYVYNELTEFATNEYIVSNSPQASSTFFLNIKPLIKTGTYKLIYKLYDGNTYIGETSESFIVK